MGSQWLGGRVHRLGRGEDQRFACSAEAVFPPSHQGGRYDRSPTQGMSTKPFTLRPFANIPSIQNEVIGTERCTGGFRHDADTPLNSSGIYGPIAKGGLQESSREEHERVELVSWIRCG